MKSDSTKTITITMTETEARDIVQAIQYGIGLVDGETTSILVGLLRIELEN
jgi:hypothetical protein